MFDRIHNKQLLDHVFGENIPCESLFLDEVRINNHGQFEIKIIVNDLPSSIPEKWKLKKYNSAIIKLSISEFDFFSIEKQTEKKNSFVIEIIDEFFKIYAVNRFIIVNLKCKFVGILEVSGGHLDIAEFKRQFLEPGL